MPVEALGQMASASPSIRAPRWPRCFISNSTHAVLFAEGAPAESFHDDGNGVLFENARPDDAPVLPPFAPIITGGPIVERT